MKEHNQKPLTELEQIQLEDARVELELKKATLRQRKQEVEKYENAEADRMSKAKDKGVALSEGVRSRRKLQDKCNHLMGGGDRAALIEGKGKGNRYCVNKIKLPTGDVMVRCPRCKKVWVPPLESDYMVDGKIDKAALKAAWDEYNKAFTFDNDLATVMTPQYRWERNGKPINREVTHRYAKAAREAAL
jgi:predicted Zn finger-like uncharacterized protein